MFYNGHTVGCFYIGFFPGFKGMDKSYSQTDGMLGKYHRNTSLNSFIVMGGAAQGLLSSLIASTAYIFHSFHIHLLTLLANMKHKETSFLIHSITIGFPRSSR